MKKKRKPRPTPREDREVALVTSEIEIEAAAAAQRPQPGKTNRTAHSPAAADDQHAAERPFMRVVRPYRRSGQFRDPLFRCVRHGSACV